MSRHTHVRTILAVAASLSVAPVAYGAGVTLWEDNFDSYANQAAMLAVYNGTGSTGNTPPAPITTYFDLGTAPAEAGNTTQSLLYHNVPASAGPSPAALPVAARNVNSEGIKPTDDAPLFWSFDFFYDGTGNKRVSGGLRVVNNVTNSNSGLLEMGYFNNARNPITGLLGSGMAVRTTLVPNANQLPESSHGGWIMFANADNSGFLTATPNTWITFAALIKPQSITYTVDLGRDGTIDGTHIAESPTDVELNLANVVFDNLRFGGPSGAGSAGGGAYFDNVVFKTLPSVPALTGDTNDDGVVDLADLNNVLNNFGATGTSPGDDNNDGVVDLTDLNNVLNNFGATAPAASALSVVPEPSALTCLLATLPLLTRRRRGA